jgi:UDP-glucose 4-epimerase
MKNILVTGGAGFVGSHACKALAAAGYNPVTLDNLERGHEWAVKWGPLGRGDIRDATVLQRVFETWRPEAVLHFAAYAYVGESNIEPLKYYQNNVGGTVSLLNALRQSWVQEFCILKLMRNLWRSRSRSTDRDRSATADQPLWAYGTCCRTNTARCGDSARQDFWQ